VDERHRLFSIRDELTALTALNEAADVDDDNISTTLLVDTSSAGGDVNILQEVATVFEKQMTLMKDHRYHVKT